MDGDKLFSEETKQEILDKFLQEVQHRHTAANLLPKATYERLANVLAEACVRPRAEYRLIPTVCLQILRRALEREYITMRDASIILGKPYKDVAMLSRKGFFYSGTSFGKESMVDLESFLKFYEETFSKGLDTRRFFHVPSDAEVELIRELYKQYGDETLGPERGITETQLALLFGVSQSTISRYLHGERRLFSKYFAHFPGGAPDPKILERLYNMARKIGTDRRLAEQDMQTLREIFKEIGQ